MVEKKFKKEFKKQLRLAIAAAIGFLIAYSWREFVFNLTTGFVSSLYDKLGPHIVDLASSVIITFIGVLVIIGTSKLLEN